MLVNKAIILAALSLVAYTTARHSGIAHERRHIQERDANAEAYADVYVDSYGDIVKRVRCLISSIIILLISGFFAGRETIEWRCEGFLSREWKLLL
jgi:hypothetical protein